MGVRDRVRCLGCGLLVNPDRFETDHHLEVVRFHFQGRGRIATERFDLPYDVAVALERAISARLQDLRAGIAAADAAMRASEF